MTVTSIFHMELANYCFDTRYADIMSSRSGLYPREAFHRLASPQTSFGVRSSCIHFSPTEGFSYERVAQFNLEWFFSKLDSGFQSPGFRILLQGANSFLFILFYLFRHSQNLIQHEQKLIYRFSQG